MKTKNPEFIEVFKHTEKYGQITARDLILIRDFITLSPPIEEIEGDLENTFFNWIETIKD